MRPPVAYTISLTVLALISLAATPAFAHHTYAMFDDRQKLTLNGTVKELQWTNPHCFLQVLIPRNGATQEWSLQMDAPLDLYRNGWRPSTLRAGDQVTVVINPSRDGRHSGAFLSGTGPDGKVLSRG